MVNNSTSSTTPPEKQDLKVTQPATKNQPSTVILEDLPLDAGRATLLDAVVVRAVRLFSAERGFIMTRTTGHIFRYEIGRDFLGKHLQEEEFKASRTVIDKVLGSKTIQIFADATHHAELLASMSIASTGRRTVLCGPLMEGEDIAGVLYIDGRLPMARLAQTHNTLFARLCEQAAKALKEIKIQDADSSDKS